MEWFLSISSSLEPVSCVRLRESCSTTHHPHRFTDGERDSSENSRFEQSRIHSSLCPPRNFSSGLRPEPWAGQLRAMPSTRPVGQGTSYTSSREARATSHLTWIPSPAGQHTPDHFLAREVWHNLWMPQWDLVPSPVPRFLTVSDIRMEFQEQNLKYTCFSNELVLTLNMLTFLIHILISLFYFMTSYLNHHTHKLNSATCFIVYAIDTGHF